jgi:rhodanese-related sulfurtransferase
MKSSLLALLLAIPMAATAACDAGGAGEPPKDKAPAAGTAPAAAPARSARITGPEARKLVASGATLLDVRSPEEWGDGHIEGAVHIPVNELGARMAELPKDKPVVVYCYSGNRSKRAAQQLAGAGYEVRDLGPMDEW